MIICLKTKMEIEKQRNGCTKIFLHTL